MALIRVKGNGPLKGTIRISGAKNAVLPIMAATLLTDEVSDLEGIPALKDVEVLGDVLRSLGGTLDTSEKHLLKIQTQVITTTEPPYDLIQKMRASFFVMGPLLARQGRAKISMPGGCAIGARPIDLHLKGFKALGADIHMDHGSIEAVVDGRLKGGSVYLDFPSVGATENIMMAATLATGDSIIENAAQEPEIVDLANFLNKMGANIKGAGSDTIRIKGVPRLKGTKHSIIPDRIEAGTYMVAACATRGDLTIENVVLSHLKPMIAKLREVGAEIIEGDDEIRVIGPQTLTAADITTLPYPGFPTDMQAQFMAMLATVEGTSVIMETVFENRFMHVTELNRMGANIKIEGHSAVIRGVKKLEGARVKATDLRAGAALMIAGLSADGETLIDNIFHIDRGYDNFEEKLRAVGAEIERIYE